MSLSVPNVIQQAVLDANNDFQKVITDVADGFKRCGFFDNPNWKALLEQCFERKKIGLTNEEIQIYSSVLSDSSYEGGFVNGLTNSAQATSTQSTPFVAGPRQHQHVNQMSRSKRSSTYLNDGPFTPDSRKKLKKTTNANENSSLSFANENGDLANMMAHLKNSDWTQILPTINNKQKLVKYVNVFEKSKQLDRASALQKPSKATNQNVVSHTVNNIHSNSQAAPTLKNVQNVLSPRIDKRRNAMYRPGAKQPADPATLSVQAEKSVTETVTTAKVSSSDGGGKLKVSQNNVVLENITNRRTTRRQTKLLAAFSGSSIETRRNTNVIQRTSVLFTMIDTLPYKNLLQTFNIFIADSNDKYDYVIAERICRSPKFLSAVVSGKPIVSLDWIHALRDKNIWLDPLQFLLKDEEGEKHYNFSLSNTLRLANTKKLFDNCSISVTPNTSISTDFLKDVIFSGGGKYLKTSLVPRKGNEIICVSDESDRKMWPKIKQKYPTLNQIITLQGFSNMIFQYTRSVSQSDVLAQY